ncbi:unnamed protein product [Caenorhabditis auriculariae]|uniref:Uncharacterized protein n=1 Tax=Caenorhabditis auriculariae TaxID=2777116 RepID=A0A8S1GM95_9PELO|nr:unnamed protein product [Caenorhabditis auriculariae]
MAPRLFAFLSLLTVLTVYADRPQSNIDQISYARQCPRDWEFECRNGECIAYYDVCDGIPQCSDGSDEINCEQIRARNNGRNRGEAATTTVAPVTTTTLAEQGYVVLTARQLFLGFVAFAVAAVAVVALIKRRARKKAVVRNRRGNILQQDSDEDDILISSMYS